MMPASRTAVSTSEIFGRNIAAVRSHRQAASSAPRLGWRLPTSMVRGWQRIADCGRTRGGSRGVAFEATNGGVQAAHAIQQLTVVEKITEGKTKTRSAMLVRFVPFTRSQD
jgi:hypothetical protein